VARRILSRINSAHVIATIALFAALGGGYAAAFSGSGSLQKENEIGIDTANYETIRSLTGIGSLQAKCSGTQTTLRFHKAGSVEDLRLWVEQSGKALNATSVTSPSFNDHDITDVAGVDEITYHAFPADGTNRPQVKLWVSVAEDLCSATQVSAMALNTQP
jgi:hypothetical protein